MSSYLALVIGAILGSSFRYFITILNFTFLGLPISTILVNIIGSAMAGYFLNKFNGALYILAHHSQIYIGAPPEVSRGGEGSGGEEGAGGGGSGEGSGDEGGQRRRARASDDGSAASL